MSDHVKILRCPVSSERLTWLDAGEVEALNAGVRVHADSSPLVEPLEGAIGTASRAFVYRFSGGIFWLLPSLAIVEPSQATLPPLDPERRMVQGFYDDLGWVKNPAGAYVDTSAFSEEDSNSKAYTAACDQRIGKELSSGRYLLDAASGAIPHDSYVAFSNNYAVRICVDFSIRALREAQTRLAEGRGLYILGDLTQLPLADGVVDDAISLHTVYHIPKALQSTAVDELVRVVRPNGKIVVVYTWDRSPLMEILARLTVAAGRTRRRRPAEPPAADQESAVDLFFVPQGRDWFEHEVKSKHNAKLKLWCSTDQRFHRKIIKRSRLALRIVLTAEAIAGPTLARIGQYPMFVIRKRSATA